MAAPRSKEADLIDEPGQLDWVSLETTQRLLAERGVRPDTAGAYLIDALLDAVRAQGWEPIVEGGPGDWQVDLQEWQEGTPVRHPASSGADLAATLRSALWEAMSLATRTKARVMFDASAREMFGISGQEFLRRYDAGELDEEDPSVIHLAMGRDFGR